MELLEARGRGFAVGKTVVPHVAGPIIFDLNVGDAGARRIARWAAARAQRRHRVRARGQRRRGDGRHRGQAHRVERAMRGGLGCATVEPRRAQRWRAPMSSTRWATCAIRASGRRGSRARATPRTAATRSTPRPRSPPARARRLRAGEYTIGRIVTNAALDQGRGRAAAALGMEVCLRRCRRPTCLSDGDALSASRWALTAPTSTSSGRWGWRWSVARADRRRRTAAPLPTPHRLRPPQPAGEVLKVTVFNTGPTSRPFILLHFKT